MMFLAGSCESALQTVTDASGQKCRSNVSSVTPAEPPRDWMRSGRTVVNFSTSFRRQTIEKMERETGVEPATSSLGSWHSTTELLPLALIICYLTVLKGLSSSCRQSIPSIASIQNHAF